MKLTFLGTSAGESYPAVWCDCPNCTYAREHGGRNIRMNTGTMIDRDVLLDMNACGFYTAARLGISLTGVTTLLATHPHPDHNRIEPLEWRRAADGVFDLPDEERIRRFSPRFTPVPMLTVYGNRFYYDQLVKPHPELYDGSPDIQMQFRLIQEGVRVETDNLAFTPVRSRHGEPGFAHSYIIERSGKTLLYALDTCGYDDDMLALILSGQYDGVVMEGTFGLNSSPNDGHMNRDRNISFRNLLLEKGCIGPKTPFILTHLAPHWTPPYDIYAPMMEKEGFIVAYDGMQYDI